MKRLITTLAFAGLFACSAFAQDTTSTGLFPQAWEGVWSGTLEIFSPKGKQQQLPMELRILPQDSCHTWTIVYDGSPRAYLLKPLKPRLGLYQIDEQNGIAMEAVYIAGKLYSRFEVMGNMLLSTAEVTTDESGQPVMAYEIISGSLEPLSVTGGGMVDGEEMPEVKGYPVVVRQIAQLRRQ